MAKPKKTLTDTLIGPVTLKNYDERMTWYGREIKQWTKNGGLWPYLSHDPETLATADEYEWERYFRQHLGGYPKSYELYRKGRMRYYNVPDEHPAFFDPSYQP